MGKKSRQSGGDADNSRNATAHPRKSIVADEQAVDPSLALLFASSAGPVKPPPKSRYQEPPPPSKRKDDAEQPEDDSEEEEAESGPDEDDLSSVSDDLEEADVADLSENGDESEEEQALDKIMESSIRRPEKKRKRKAEEDDLEGNYMQKLAEEEEKEEVERRAERRLKRQRLMAEQDPDMSEESEDLNEDQDDDPREKDSDENSEVAEDGEDDSGSENGDLKRIAPSDVPLHESLAPNKGDIELEKAARTIFLANVSTLAISSKAAKKTLLSHLSSFLASLPDPPEGKPAHKVESLRFRSTAYATTALPKKAAFVKKDLMVATTKSTNAYVVYSTAFAAREAVKKLNGTMVLDRHLRVDGVAHPAKTDHRRCVFVGNLGFVDDESMLDQGGENERKRSKIPSDIEEGLWRQFGKAGTVESVRVIRDEKTRVGKGFAYVQFQDANAVEAALLFNEKKYPPMLPRVLRVVRAKAIGKTSLALARSRVDSKSSKVDKQRIYNPKDTSEFSSLKGRAGNLLGRAGAAKFKKGSGANETVVGKRGSAFRGEGSGIEGIARTPEAIIFEGYRASANNGKPSGLKLGGGGGKKKGKPRTRSSKRGTEWKKTGGRKAK